MIDLYRITDFLPIEGECVSLKTYTVNNITDDYLSWLNDPETVRYSNQRFTQHTRQSSLDYLQTFVNTENLFIAIYLKKKEIYVGTMNVYISAAHETADIGIMVGDRKCWGTGIGGECPAN